MFKKLFGGGDKKEQAPPPPPPPPPVSKDIEAEKVIKSLEAQIRTLTDESNKLDNKVDVLTEKAKEYIAANKKKEAKQTVAQLNELKKKIELINTRKKVMRTQKNQLEIAKMDLSLAEEMGKATDIMKSMESVNEKMTDIMLDAKEIAQNMEETNRLMKELAGEDQEDEQADELFKQLEGQVQTEKAEQIKAGLNKMPVPAVKQVQGSTLSTTTKASNASVQDDLNKWLN